MERLDAAEGPAPGPAQVARDLLYRSFFKHALHEVHIWELVRDAQGRIVTWRLVDANGAALKSWGRELAAIVGRTTDEIFPGADPVATFLPVVEEIMRTGQPKEWETTFTGTGQVLHMVSIPVGEFFVSTGFDVTADRRRERELQDALRSLNQATQAGGVGLWDWNLTTDRVHYSDQWKRQLGCAPHEISDRLEEWQSRVHPDDLEPTLERVRFSVAHPDQQQNVVFRMRHQNGSYRWILAQASIICDDEGRPQRMLGSHVDITERRLMEERLIEAQKLESIGTLAAGIAHDFNNLLAALIGNLSVLRDTPPTAPELPALLHEMDEAAWRATGLTRQLLTFSRGGSPIRDVVSIKDLIIDSARFVTRGSSARCVFDVADDLSAVKADAGQLSQVVNNLVINAAQAMPHGGTIHLTAKNVRLGGEHASGLPAGDYVHLAVADQGTGISAEHLPRIFDPFFTTKPKGSGLGLATSHSIVARHGGTMTVQSKVGEGTVFDVYLPVSTEAPQANPEVPVLAGKGRLLLMDDDAAVAKVLLRMVTRLGYECDVCANGDEALRCVGDAVRQNRRYDAVLLDLTIAGHRGGAEVLPELKALDPDVVGIVISGYADDDVLAHHGAHGFRARLQKPVDIAELSAALARVLS